MFNKTEFQNYFDLDLQDCENLAIRDNDELSIMRLSTLRKTIFKKFKDDAGENANVAAIAIFKEMNEHCKSFHLAMEDPFIREVVGYVKHDMWRIFDPLSWECINYTWEELFSHGGLGPGANLHAPSYNFYTKLFDSDLSSTCAALHRVYTSCADRYSSTLLNAERTRFGRHGNRIVKGNKLTTVTKNIDVSRCICTEPTLNMFFQKGLGALFEKVLKSEHNISLDSQPLINNAMAKLGSVSGTLCTIDLRSASDTISNTLLEALLPHKLYRLLQVLRSPISSVGDEEIVLHMVSTQGNGFNFPLQTLLFASIVRATYRALGITPKNGLGRNYSVFGDDIIVIDSAYHKVLETLTAFGFIVNHDKSFGSGHFRESCGGDYFRGYNVRGFYIKSLLTQNNVNAAYNGILIWMLRTGLHLQRTEHFLRQFCKNYVPLFEDPSSGFYSTSKRILSRSYRKSVVIPRKYVPESLPYKGAVKYQHNPNGLLQTFIGGYLRDGRITLRSATVKYKYVKVHSYISHECQKRISRVYADFDPTWIIQLEHVIQN